MADGYARASGRFGAVMGIGGPGLCNMATAVAAAKTDASPVLVLSGEIPVDMEGLGEFQDASQATLDDTAVMKPLTRLSGTVASPRSLNHWLRHALTTMWAQPRGPVHLSVTHDVMSGECTADYAGVSGYFEAVAPLSRPAAVAALNLLDRTEDRDSCRRRRRARQCGRRVDGGRGALGHSRRDDAARQGRLPGRSRIVARGVRLCRHPPRDGRHPERSGRRADRARLRLQRARHHALDPARAGGQGRHPSGQHRHGRVDQAWRSHPCHPRKLPCLPRSDGGTRGRPSRLRSRRGRRSGGHGWPGSSRGRGSTTSRIARGRPSRFIRRPRLRRCARSIRAMAWC